MSDHRRADRRAFRPGLDGRVSLEPRLLLSTAQVAAAATANHIHARVAFGGKIALIKDVDGELFSVVIVGRGSVRATPMSGGRVKLTVVGTNSQSILAINPGNRLRVKGSAHTFPSNQTRGDNLLHIGEIQVKTGRINQILGYRTADLSGPLLALSDAPVNRIAFESLQPGATIRVGQDLDTLDVLTDANLGGTGGIFTARDLNWFNVGGTVNIGSGSQILVGRDVGLTPQAGKGTASGGQGGRIMGDLNIADGGSFTITRTLQAQFLIDGNATGASNVSVPFGASNFFVRGPVTA